MKIKDIIKSLKAEDSPIMTVPEHDSIVEFLRKTEKDVTYEQLAKAIGISTNRMLEINQEVSLHWKVKLAPRVLYKSMLSASRTNSEEFKIFFQRPDVDISCLFQAKISDLKKRMRNYDTPQYWFIIDNWKKYRGY